MKDHVAAQALACLEWFDHANTHVQSPQSHLGVIPLAKVCGSGLQCQRHSPWAYPTTKSIIWVTFMTDVHRAFVRFPSHDISSWSKYERPCRYSSPSTYIFSEVWQCQWVQTRAKAPGHLGPNSMSYGLWKWTAHAKRPAISLHGQSNCGPLDPHGPHMHRTSSIGWDDLTHARTFSPVFGILLSF